jgi:hypothetical protein
MEKAANDLASTKKKKNMQYLMVSKAMRKYGRLILTSFCSIC